MPIGKKTGGRKKGTPNKVTKELRTLLKDILYHELDNLEERLEDLTPKERIETLIKLMPFAFPKLDKIHPTTNEPMDWDIQ